MNQTDIPENMKPDAAKNRRAVIIASVLVLVIVAASSALVVHDLNGGSLDLSGRQVLLIVSGSMDGDSDEYEIHSFPARTMAMAKNLTDEEKAEISVGDVVLYHLGSIKITHRVVDTSHIDEGYVITKGDASSSTETVYFAAIEGEVVGTNHALGEVAIFVRANFFLIFGAIFAIIAADILLGAYFKDRSEKETEK